MKINDQVVKLCIEGQRAEARGKKDEALKYFNQAWKIRENDLDACIAAHFVAKIQKDFNKTLRWNLTALKFARKASKDAVKDFYPSLFINIADSYEKTGRKGMAKKYFDLAATAVSTTSLGSYGILLSESIQDGQKRTS
jgi:tetratricopeptide (TPR) repeat protein